MRTDVGTKTAVRWAGLAGSLWVGGRGSCARRISTGGLGWGFFQFLLQCPQVIAPRRLHDGDQGAHAVDFDVYRLHMKELSLGGRGGLIEVVRLVVDFDGGHGKRA